MTISNALNSISTVTIGEGGSATDAYPVLQADISTTPEGIDATSGVTTIARSITLICVAEASSEDEIAQLGETLEADLNRRGDLVTITELGGAARQFVAGGTEPMHRGFPRVSYTRLESGVGAESIGTVQVFRLNIETRENIADTDPIHHESDTRESLDENAYATFRQTGRVRTLNGTAARTWLDANVIVPAATAAANNNRLFTVDYRQGTDPSFIEYEYTDRALTTNGTPLAITALELSTSLNYQREGGTVTTIAGNVSGPEAALFAAAQRPSIATNQALVREEITQPEDPSGRVSFRFEVLEAGTDPGLPSVNVLSFRRTFSVIQTGGRPLRVATFADADPVLWRGANQPCIIEERTVMTYINADPVSNISVNGLAADLDEDQIIGEPIVSHGFVRPGVRSLGIVRRYMYETTPTIPDPKIFTLPGSA